MRFATLLMVMGLVGCGHVIESPFYFMVDLDEAALRPSVSSGDIKDYSWWFDHVDAATTSWNDALVSVGCPPLLRVTRDPDEPAYEVRLVLTTDPWNHYPWMGITYGGVLGVGYIELKWRPDGNMYDLLMHELGHAIGLNHAESGVMAVWPTAAAPTEHDLDMLRDVSAKQCSN